MRHFEYLCQNIEYLKKKKIICNTDKIICAQIIAKIPNADILLKI